MNGAPVLTPTPSRCRSSAGVASGSSRTNSRTRASCGARTAGRPALGGSRASDPVALCRCLSRRTQDSLTEYFRAAAGVFIPAWQSAHTRSRRSIEHARIGTPQRGPSVPPEPEASRYIFPETALEVEMTARPLPVSQRGEGWAAPRLPALLHSPRRAEVRPVNDCGARPHSARDRGGGSVLSGDALDRRDHLVGHVAVFAGGEPPELRERVLGRGPSAPRVFAAAFEHSLDR